MSNNQIDNTKIIYNEKESNPELRLQGQWVNDVTPLSATNLNAMLNAVKKSTKEIANIPMLQASVTKLNSDLASKANTTDVADEIAEINTRIDNIQLGETNLKNYYTIAQTDDKFATKQLLQESLDALDIDAPEYEGGSGITVSDNTISADLIDVYTATENDTKKIPTASSVKENLDLKLEGFSSKYYIIEKGWHRVLNTIRGNGGRLNLTLSDGRSLQSLEIDLSGFVKLGIASPGPEESGYVFCKSNSSFLGPKQTFAHADPYFKYKITAMRMGYASDEALRDSEETPYDPTANGPRSVNCYIDVFIDRNISNEDASNIDAQMLTQFTGKSYQHNCYPIIEETTDENYKTTVANDRFPNPTPITLQYGMYGEPLSFINIPIRDDYDIAEEGYKKKLTDNFDVKLGENTTPSLLNAEHNLANISRITFNNSESLDSSKYRFFRKYNMLPVFFDNYAPNSSNPYSNDWLSVYNWEGGNPTSRFNGGNILSAFRSGKKTTASGNVAYGMTTSGTLIFVRTSEDALTSAYKTFNIYFNNTETDCVILPAGTYMTNVSDIYYSDEPLTPTKYSAKTGNSVGGTVVNKCFKLDEPMYLTTARLSIAIGIQKHTLELFTPFLIKVPDDIQLGSKSNNAYTITDERWKNFSVKSNISNILENIPEGETAFDFVSGWLELTEGVKKHDFIKITDIDGKEHIIKHFSDFYTSWRAGGECEIPDDGIIKENSVDNKLIQTYDLFADKSENPYDTLFMFNGLTPVSGSVYNNNIIDLKSLAEKNVPVKVSQTKPSNLPDNSVWVKPLTQEITPPAVYIKEAGSINQGETIDGIYYINSDGTFDMYVNASAADFVDNGTGKVMIELEHLPFNVVSDNSLMIFGSVKGYHLSVYYTFETISIVVPELPLSDATSSYKLNAHIRGKIL